jgi:3-hydroxyisobutyrate dehydrogenase-like beta-hydroxyacid dehydrogenase
MSTGKPKIGFIGVGLMGHGMAKNIVEKGYPLTVLGHRNRKPVEDLLRRGAAEASSPAALAKASDIVFLCVTGTPQVEALVQGPDGLKAGAHEGLIIADCSTALPSSTLALAAELKPLGVRFVDLPLARTPKEAEAGRLNAFVGADDATLAELTPVIECWAENIIHVGPVGTAHSIKLINNFIAMSYAATYAEAFAAARKAGLEPATLHQVISAGILNSGFYQNMAKWVIEGDPEAHLFTLRNCVKDISYYTLLADSLPITPMLGNAVKQTYTIALSQGRGDQYLPRVIDAMAEFNGVNPGAERP